MIQRNVFSTIFIQFDLLVGLPFRFSSSTFTIHTHNWEQNEHINTKWISCNLSGFSSFVFGYFRFYDFSLSFDVHLIQCNLWSCFQFLSAISFFPGKQKPPLSIRGYPFRSCFSLISNCRLVPSSLSLHSFALMFQNHNTIYLKI